MNKVHLFHLICTRSHITEKIKSSKNLGVDKGVYYHIMVDIVSSNTAKVLDETTFVLDIYKIYKNTLSYFKGIEVVLSDEGSGYK